MPRLYTGMHQESPIPPDWQQPCWGEAQKCHDWKNYPSAELQAIWATFTEMQQRVLAACFEELAGREEWD